MYEVPFTQYLLPNGERRAITIGLNGVVEPKVKEILAANYRFEAEMLRTGEVSFTIYDKVEGVDAAIEICANGPEVPVVITKMILGFNVVPKEARQRGLV